MLGGCLGWWVGGGVGEKAEVRVLERVSRRCMTEVGEVWGTRVEGSEGSMRIGWRSEGVGPGGSIRFEMFLLGALRLETFRLVMARLEAARLDADRWALARIVGRSLGVGSLKIDDVLEL